MEHTREGHEKVTEPGMGWGGTPKGLREVGGRGPHGETEAASQGPTLHPEDVVLSSGPGRVTGCAFIEAAVTDLGLGQMQGAQQEEVMPEEMRDTGETPTNPTSAGKVSGPSCLLQEACQN